MVKVRDVSILQEDFEQIYLLLAETNAMQKSKKLEAHNNFSNEFTSEVSIHLLLIVQFWHSTW